MKMTDLWLSLNYNYKTKYNKKTITVQPVGEQWVPTDTRTKAHVHMEYHPAPGLLYIRDNSTQNKCPEG